LHHVDGSLISHQVWRQSCSLLMCNTRKFHHNKILLSTWFSFIF
jgi:hypothetical protein